MWLVFELWVLAREPSPSDDFDYQTWLWSRDSSRTPSLDSDQLMEAHWFLCLVLLRGVTSRFAGSIILVFYLINKSSIICVLPIKIQKFGMTHRRLKCTCASLLRTPLVVACLPPFELQLLSPEDVSYLGVFQVLFIPTHDVTICN